MLAAALRTSARLSLVLLFGGVGCACQPLYFKSPAVGQRVALGFLNQNGDVLLRICSVRVLRFDGDAIEDPQVVQPPLRFHYFAFSQWFFDSDLNLSTNHSRPRVLVAADQNSPYPCLRAFLDVIHQPDPPGSLNLPLT